MCRASSCSGSSRPATRPTRSASSSRPGSWWTTACATSSPPPAGLACRSRSNSPPSTRCCRRDARPEHRSALNQTGGRVVRGPRFFPIVAGLSSALLSQQAPEGQASQAALILMPFVFLVHAEKAALARRNFRSEEHTSELQSLAYLVCRLLLEKKKQNIPLHMTH